MIRIEDRDNYKYASVDYWNERYTKEKEYDWLGDYKQFRHLINKHVSKDSKILMVGCGNSRLSQDMHLDGYSDVCSTDISEVCIENQKELFPHLSWQVADITNLGQFKNGEFDVVIEKATLDALLVEEKSPWHPSDNAQAVMDASLSEVSRILKPAGGTFLSFTFAQPHFREPFYAKAKYDWSVQTETFGGSFVYFCYVMTRGQPLDEDQVSVTTAVGISKLTINPNCDGSSASDSSSEGEDFTSRIDFSFEEDEEEEIENIEPFPRDDAQQS